MINLSTCTEEELWKHVASHLEKHHIRTVLSGGAVASIYSQRKYTTKDLDFILSNYTFSIELKPLLNDLGFKLSENAQFKHPECLHLSLYFKNDTLSIGEDYNVTPIVREHNKQKIKILSPTDCIKDRLVNHIYFNRGEKDLQGALEVAQRHEIDLKEIERWCGVERRPDIYKKLNAGIEEIKKATLRQL